MKKIYIFDTTDKRNEFLLAKLLSLGELAIDFKDILVDKTQMPTESSTLHTIENSGCLSVDDYKIIYVLSPSFKSEPKLIPHFVSGSTVYYYNAESAFLSELQRKNVSTICIMADESYVCKNSMLTAEGALAHAIMNTETSLFEQNVLILGFGHLGKAVCSLFSHFAKNVTVATNNEFETGASTFFFVHSLSLINAEKTMQNFDVIINTIPAKIFEKTPKFKDNALILELASKIYPFDYDSLSEQKIKFEILGGLPAKTSFRSAGELLLRKITE